MWKLNLSKTVHTVFLFCAVTATPSAAQTFTTLANFNGTNGFGFKPALVQGTDGNLYGTTGYGGDFTCNITLGMGCGTVFRVTPGGTLATLHAFNGPEGWIPSAGLVEATDGNFYGTTEGGGANSNISTCFAGCGTVFKITPRGTLTTLYSFCAQTNCTDGAGPSAGLVQATDGNFYGTTLGGGTNNSCSGGCGTVFRITPNGKLSTLYNFCAQTNCTDGYNASGLVQATDGNFYGTNSAGGSNNNCTGGCGTVFRITPGGALTTLHSFNFADGWIPSGLVQGTDGNLYGTTQGGGANSLGTVFKITPGGTLTTLHSFGGTDGGNPVDNLVQATDSNFYGTTNSGGDLMCNAPHGCGVIFKIVPGGALTTLHNFIYADGIYPGGGLVQGTDGNFYGATFQGGNLNLCNTFGCGTVFSLSVGLGPFVETIPTSGAVGVAVIILGNNLTGATGVRFNGTAATFSVVSSSEIQTTVPASATTGIVQVTTPTGTLNSNVPFQVTKTRKRLVQVTSE